MLHHIIIIIFRGLVTVNLLNLWVIVN